MQIKSYAKLNLSLNVLGKRTDGFHELDMLVQMIDLCDIITITETNEGLRVSSNIAELKNDDSNTVYKAARLMMEKYSIKGGFDIHIEKNIPLAAGMGGGSGNAASVMTAIAEHRGIEINLDELDEIALKVGTEVVYFLRGGLCKVSGKGETVEKLVVELPFKYFVINPSIALSTAEVYAAIHKNEYSTASYNNELISRLELGNYKAFLDMTKNDLQQPAIRKCNIIADLIRDMENFGFAKLLMTGSGPSVFGIIEDGTDVSGAFEYARENNYHVYLCEGVKGV